MDSLGQGLEAYDAIRASSELVRRAPSLFLPETAIPQLEIREYTTVDNDRSLPPTSKIQDESQVSRSLSVPYFIYTADDLLSVLKVSLQFQTNQFRRDINSLLTVKARPKALKEALRSCR